MEQSKPDHNLIQYKFWFLCFLRPLAKIYQDQNRKLILLFKSNLIIALFSYVFVLSHHNFLFINFTMYLDENSNNTGEAMICIYQVLRDHKILHRLRTIKIRLHWWKVILQSFDDFGMPFSNIRDLTLIIQNWPVQP